MQYESGHPIHRRITRSSNPLAQLLTFDRKFSEFGWAKLPPPPPPPPPPPSPPCPAAEKLIVDACKRDAQRFIIWKLEGPLTKASPPPFFFYFGRIESIVCAWRSFVTDKKKEEEENTFEYSSRCNPRDLRWNHGGWIIIHGDNWVLRNFNNFIWLDNS